MLPGMRIAGVLAVAVLLYLLQGASSKDLTQAHRRLACKWDNWKHKMDCGKLPQKPPPSKGPTQHRPRPPETLTTRTPATLNATMTSDKVLFKEQAKQHSRMQLLKADTKDVSFVHATKTGGTALELHLMTHGEQCPMLHFFVGHSFRESELQQQGYQTLIILREPSDRIRSSFDYAKHGSTFHGNSTVTNDAKLFDDANDFVDALRNNSHALHKTAWYVVEHREGGVQFKPEEHWLNGNPSRRSTVCYSGDLGSSVSQAVNLHVLGKNESTTDPRELPCNITIPRSNVSSKRSVDLNELNANWIRLESMYAADFNHWRKLCFVVHSDEHTIHEKNETATETGATTANHTDVATGR